MANAAPAPVAFGQKMRFCTSAIAPHTYPACSISLNGVNNVFVGPNSRHNIPEPYTAQASAGSALRIICSPSASSGRKPRPRGRLSTLCNPHYAFLPSAAPAARSLLFQRPPSWINSAAELLSARACPPKRATHHSISNACFPAPSRDPSANPWPQHSALMPYTLQPSCALLMCRMCA